MLHNLLTNAIKFTRKGNIIIKAKIRPLSISRNEYSLKVSVTDSGIGMSQDEASRIFDGNFATNNQDSKALNPYSNRIGLSLCKQLCQSLDGNISVKSEIGKGSIFSFTMKVKGTDSLRGSGEEESEEFIDENQIRESREKAANDRLNPDQVLDVYDPQFEDALDADFQSL